MRLLLRVLAGLALLVLGGSASLSAALVHQRWWGLMLGLGAAALTTRALPAGGWRLAFVLGWLGTIGYLVLPRSEGDYLVPGNPAGWALLGGSFVLFLVALATVARPVARLGSSPAARRGPRATP